MDGIWGQLSKGGPVYVVLGYLLFQIFQVYFPKHEESMQRQIEICNQMVSSIQFELRKVNEQLDHIERRMVTHSP